MSGFCGGRVGGACHGAVVRRERRFWAYAGVLLIALVIGGIAQASVPPAPAWVTHRGVVSNNGYARLQWTAPAAESRTFYRITETVRRRDRVSYTNSTQMTIYRLEPGNYRFRVAACERGEDLAPSCGPDSSRLKIVVAEEINRLTQAPDPALASPDAPAAVAGGPDELRPGLWYNPNKRGGHGFSFYWANRLALPESHNLYGNAFDLVGIWYTYEAKLRYSDAPCGFVCNWIYDEYRPVAARLNLVWSGGNSYSGGIFITRNGQAIQVGNATIEFGADNSHATISWSTTFKWQSLSAVDDIELLVGSVPGSWQNDTHYSGLWIDETDSSYFVAHSVGAFGEAVEVVFSDSNGDPTWIQAGNSWKPSAEQTDMCFYYVAQGNAASLPGPLSIYQSGCAWDVDASVNNRNGGRTFTGFEASRFWVSFDLPGGSASGQLHKGVVAAPRHLVKQASFHRISYRHRSGNGCQLSNTSTECEVTLTWFSDGDYPSASAFIHHLPSGQRQVIAAATTAAVDYVYEVNDPGTYRFELRMGTSSASTLIAESATFQVSQASIGAPDGLSINWSNQADRQFKLNWAHSNPSSVQWYEVEEVRPGSENADLHTVSPGSSTWLDIDAGDGPYGSYDYRVRACTDALGNTQCSTWTAAINWVVEPPSDGGGAPGSSLYPWQEAANPQLFELNKNYHYALGYHFLTLAEGQVRELGGYFNGTKRVRLFERASGALLAEATVSCTYQWCYAPIEPVSLQVDREYTVAAYLAGSGASYQSGADLPRDSKKIRILGSTYASTGANANAVPTNLITGTMYGQADIGFVAGTEPNQAPILIDPGNQAHVQDEVVTLQMQATDSDGDTLAFFQSGLPKGLTLDADSGLVSGTLLAEPGSYSVAIAVSDGKLESEVVFQWLVTPQPDNGAWVDLLVDDFSLDLGWLTNRRGTDSSTRGQWHRTDPEQTIRDSIVYQPSNTVSGKMALITDGRGGSIGRYDVDRGATSISSPLLTLPAGAESISLKFQFFFAHRASANAQDWFRVLVVGDGSEDQVFEISGTQIIRAGEWEAASVDLTAYAGKQIYIEFEANDGADSGTVIEAGVDDVFVRYLEGATAPPPVQAANPEKPPAPASAPGISNSVLESTSRVGMIKGQFNVDDAGNATYRIPLMAAVGSGGLTPGLALQYHSRAGNGPTGVGWQLSGTSAIQRCAHTFEQDGTINGLGVTLSDTDRFCLDGQRLVVVQGNYGESGSEYRTEIESFQRVVSYGRAGTGPAYFRVWRRDGSVLDFGNTEDSRIESRHKDGPDTALLWLQNSLTDSASNTIEYSWSESGAGPVDFVLERVRYAANQRAGTQAHAEFEFYYEGGRTDTSRSWIAGAAIQDTRLLVKIESRGKIRSTDSSFNSLRAWFLSYGENGFGQRVLEQVSECSDASGSTCFAPTRFDWLKGEHAVSQQGRAIGSIFPDHLAALQTGDVNGDGRPDLLLTEKNGAQFYFKVAYATAAGGFTLASSRYNIPNNGDEDEPVALQVIDFNADGYQDVLYPREIDGVVSLMVRLSAATGPGTESVAFDAQNTSLSLDLDPDEVHIMDYDGDGLADLLTSSKAADGTSQLLMLRNTFTPGGSPGLAIPIQLTIDTAPFFPHQTTDGWRLDDEVPHFQFNPTKGVSGAKPFDYNGDGAIDLLVRVTRQYAKCEGSCHRINLVPDQPHTAGGSRFLLSVAEDLPDRLDEGVYARAGFYLIFLSDQTASFYQPQVVGLAGGIDCVVIEICTDPQYAGLPRIERVSLVDINADGLADMVFQQGDDPNDVVGDETDEWYYRINTGRGLESAIHIAEIAEESGGDVRLFDFNGDGYPDLLYPDEHADSDARWVLQINDFGQGFSAEFATGMTSGNIAGGDSSVFLEFTGDGMIDHLFIDMKADGSGIDKSDTLLFMGHNLITGRSDEAMNVIWQITDGWGAETRIEYLPLTDATVYTRMNNSAAAAWGRGSAVYDLVAPIYVVSEVIGSAPTFSNVNATSLVRYHYAGARLQAGGRGFLGFGEFISFDPQSGIRSNRRIRQDFPFRGLPVDVTRVLAGSGQELMPISDPDEPEPEFWHSVSASTSPPASVGGL